jgi:hypothetical protein
MQRGSRETCISLTPAIHKAEASGRHSALTAECSDEPNVLERRRHRGLRADYGRLFVRLLGWYSCSPLTK